MLQEEELPEVVVVVDFETKEFPLQAVVEFTRSKEAADRRPSSAAIEQTVAVVKASPNHPTASRCPCRR